MKKVLRAVVPKHEHELSVKKTALTLGSFAALLHAVWAVLVAFDLAQGLLNWRLGMHFINLPLIVTPFDAVNAVFLVIMAFIGGAVIGTVFATIWNKIQE